MSYGEMAFGRIVDGKFVADGPVSVIRGKKGCKNLGCSRMGRWDPETQLVDDDGCYGWHCATCGEPTDAQGGHRCLGPVSDGKETQ